MKGQKISKRKKITRKTGKRNPSICMNPDCKLRKGGCRGFEACPGYYGK
jgi:hypothetical protein